MVTPPPPFVVSRVVDIARRTPRLTMVVSEGDGLGSMVPADPAASIRLLLPRGHAADELELPTHDGNVFRYADGELSTARTLTPLSAGHPDRMLLGVHDHGSGRLSKWLGELELGNQVGIAGPGQAYEIDQAARRFVVAGDESALPAIGQLLEAFPDSVAVEVAIEIGSSEARTEMPEHPGCRLSWLPAQPAAEPGGALVDWVVEQPIDDDTRLWVAGEAAAVQRIRKAMDAAGVPRSRRNIRGYWKLRG